MKAIAFPLVLALAGGMAFAHEGTKTSSKATTSMEKKEAATRMEGEIVSTDAAANSFVLKTASGDQTLTARGKAAARLKDLKAGEKVVVKSRDNEVFSISTVKARTAHHASSTVAPKAAASRKY